MTRPERREVEAALGHPLSDPQWAAVSAPLEPAAIVAGAGSGKTTVMAARVVWAVQTGRVEPARVLGLTFTTKAAAELLGRTRRLLATLGPHDADEAGDPSISTYHSFAGRLLSDHGIRIGLEPTATLLTDGRRHELAARVVAASAEPLAGLGRSPATIVGDLLALDDTLAELAVEPERVRVDAERMADDLLARDEVDGLQRIGRDMLLTCSRRAVLAGLVVEFRAAKAERHVIDFADQVRLALRLVRTSPELVADLRERFGLVLLDEYQDTSVAQRILLQGAFAGGHPVTAVGDPCQAIYEWRGASVENIDRFPVQFPATAPDGSAHPAARYPLADNRRSAPAILDLANELAEPLRARHPGVEPLIAAATDRGRGDVRCAYLPTIDDEVAWVADAVAAFGAAGPWREIAVLSRTAGPLLALDRELRARGIPAHLTGSAPLLAHPVIAVLRATLEALIDPAANGAVVRLLAGPRWRIGARDLAALGRIAARLARSAPVPGADAVDRILRAAVAGSDVVERASLLEAAEALADGREPAGSPALSAEARTRIRAFATELRGLRRHLDDPVIDLVGRVLASTGLGVEAHVGDPVDVEQAGRALAAFRDLAAEADLDGRVSLVAFLARLRAAEEFEAEPALDPPARDDAVALMTVHKAKGLEYPHVLVLGMSATVFPSTRSRPRWPTAEAVIPWHLRDDAPPELLAFPDPAEGPRAKDHDAFAAASRALEAEEERRLAYVAVTRAERTLTLSGHGWGGTQKSPREPGEFLREARAWAEGGPGEVVTWVAPPEDNPLAEVAARGVAWPVPADPQRQARLMDAARAVAAAAPMLPEAWQALGEALVDEARRRRRPPQVALPAALSASDLVRLGTDPAGFAADLARPMPQAPRPGAHRGTRFHAWVESRFGTVPLLDIDDLPGAADEVPTDPDLEALQRAFERTPYAARTPLAVEAPFTLALGGRVLRGRIDAVFAGPDGRAEVVDWKTGGRSGLSHIQLAVYRLAWAAMTGVDPQSVDAAFVLVATGEVVRPESLPSESDLLALLS